MTETIVDKTEREAAPPESWSYATVDEVSEINPRYSQSDVSEETEVSFVPMKAVEELSGRIDLSETKAVVDVKKRYTAFKEGDVLSAKKSGA